MVFDADPVRLSVSPGEFLGGPILELLVPDRDAARRELEQRGCVQVPWKGDLVLMRDPFGISFHLYEDPRAFGESE